MNNFETVELFSGDDKKVVNTGGKKGIDEEIKLFIDALKNGRDMPISFREIYDATRLTFACLASLEAGIAIELE
jgi:hypothetical protein